MPSKSVQIGEGQQRFLPERLAYWYLRLNGFFLLENFIIHPDTGADQRTVADLIGIRLAHRAENPVRPMRDDRRICDSRTLISVVIAEVKSDECELNGPWTRPGDENIQRVLRAIGCVPEAAVSIVANELYALGRAETPECTCRLLAFGDRRATLPIADVEQIVFDEMIDFIHARFQEYHREKRSVGNWTEDGRLLAAYARQRASDRARQDIRACFSLPEVAEGTGNGG